MRACAWVLLVACGTAGAVAAQQPEEKYRVISGGLLRKLSAAVQLHEAAVTTGDLKGILSADSGTNTLLVTDPTAAPADADRVWYTQREVTTLQNFKITRHERALLWIFATTKALAVNGFSVGVDRVAVTSVENGMTVTKMILVVKQPSEAELKGVADAIAGIEDATAREVVQLATAARFAELYPDGGQVRDIPPVVAQQIEGYKKKTLATATARVEKLPADQIVIGQPLFAGTPATDPLRVAQLFQNAVPKDVREIKGKRFATVWEGPTLVLVPLPPRANTTAVEVIDLSTDWKTAIDPKAKPPLLKPFVLK